jgi:hypothetical protein
LAYPGQEFFGNVINNKLVLILDIGFNSYASKPVLFEKSLKLLATLIQFPNFHSILTTSIAPFDANIQKYLSQIADLLSH